VPDEVLAVEEGTTMPTDCQDAGCPDGEECQPNVSHGSVRHVCVCPSGYERDANSQRCKLVSNSGQYICGTKQYASYKINLHGFGLNSLFCFICSYYLFKIFPRNKYLCEVFAPKPRTINRYFSVLF